MPLANNINSLNSNSNGHSIAMRELWLKIKTIHMNSFPLICTTGSPIKRDVKNIAHHCKTILKNPHSSRGTYMFCLQYVLEHYMVLDVCFSVGLKVGGRGAEGGEFHAWKGKPITFKAKVLLSGALGLKHDNDISMLKRAASNYYKRYFKILAKWDWSMNKIK